jgi:hypothetical protein
MKYKPFLPFFHATLSPTYLTIIAPRKEVACTSEMSRNFYQLHGATSQKTVISSLKLDAQIHCIRYMNCSMLSCNGTIVSRSLFCEFSYSVESDCHTKDTPRVPNARPVSTHVTVAYCALTTILYYVVERQACLSLTCKFRWRSQSTSRNLQTLSKRIVHVTLLRTWLWLGSSRYGWCNGTAKQVSTCQTTICTAMFVPLLTD